MSLLESIHSPQDLKKIPSEQLPLLAAEIREFLIASVKTSGGHLASNLGVVELTIALHYVFSSPQDTFIWDVGHQTYVHKILTGRKEKMQTIRSYGGISGFPKFQESAHDSYNTGHAGTSISQALGEAVARDLKKEKKNIVAIIGDASIACGMAIEALNHAGHIRHPFLVILNDNEMSISENVGALSFSLNQLITTRFYRRWSRVFFKTIEWVPFIGPMMRRILSRFASNMKSVITELQFFEELGFRYLGPLDGHDIKKLSRMLQRLQNLEVPTLLHVVTKKGKGYKPAEDDPTRFHGISPTPVVKSAPQPADQSKTWGLSEFAGRCLTYLAATEKKLCVTTPAMSEGSGLTSFAAAYPERFFDAGIAEQHATTFAGALAKSGLVSFLAIYSTFLQRGYDQLIHDILLMDLPVKLLIDRAGAVGNDGETHQGLYDISYMYPLPNIEIFSPLDAEDLLNTIAFAAAEKKTAMAIRFAKRSFQEKIFWDWQKKQDQSCSFSPYAASLLQEGNDVLLLCEGGMSATALQCTQILQKQGVSLQVLAIRSLKPLPAQEITAAAQNKKAVFTLENHVAAGGMGMYIEKLLLPFLQKNSALFFSFAYPDKIISHGSIGEIEKHYGLDADSLAATINRLLKDL